MEISCIQVNLLSLQEKGLSYFSIFDIRSKQAFLSAHLQDSILVKDEQDIVKFYNAFPNSSAEFGGGGGGTILF